MKRIFATILMISIILSCCVPALAENSVASTNSDNSLTYKEKYVELLEKLPDTENRNIIVKYKNTISDNDNVSGGIKHANLKPNNPLASIGKLNCIVEKTIEKKNIAVVKANSNNVKEVITALNNDENVVYAQPDYKVIAAEDEFSNKQWAIQNYGQTVDRSTGETGFDINLVDAWNTTQGDESVVIGVIDTGIDIAHVDLANSIWVNDKEIINGIDDDGNGYIDDINGWDFANNDSSVYDMDALDEHGTHMAGIIAANGTIKGVAPKVKLMPLKALNYSSGYTSDIIEAIEYAKEQGVRIINCSFASIEYNPALEEAIASNPDMLFVCAAGNYGKPTTDLATFPACYDLDNVLTVSAANNKGQLSEISSYGEYVDVSAPGIGIYSTLPEDLYGFKDGTSCSAAYVSGVAALLLSDNSDLNTIKLKNKIINSCGSNLPKQTENGTAETEGLIDVVSAFVANETIGKHDDFEYTPDVGTATQFEKYPFEFVNDNGNIKIQFDTSRQISSFYLKVYQSTEEKEHTNLVNGSIPTNTDYQLSGITQNIDYKVVIKTEVEGLKTEYSCALKYVVSEELSSLDFDIIAEESYGDISNIPINNTVYNTAEEKEQLAITQAAGTRYEQENNNTMSLADLTYDDYDTYGYMNTASDIDYFKIMFDSSGVANFWLGNIPSEHDYDLYVYNEDGALLARSTNGDSDAELISYYPVEADKYYYMMVKTYEGSSTSLPYLLRAKWYSEYSDYEPNDTISTATIMPGYTYNEITEKISTTSDIDYYRVRVPYESIFELKLSRPNNTYRFEIYSSSNTNESLIYTDKNTFSRKLSSGNYYILVYRTSGSSASTYTLKTSCSPISTIGTSSSLDGEIDTTTNNTYYKLSLSSAVGLEILLSNYGSSDYDLFLYDASFDEIASSQDTTTIEIIQYMLESGTYYIRVKRYDGENISYTIDTSVTVPSNDAYLVTGTGYPTEMTVNEVKAITILAENEGASTWTSSAGYKLAALNSSSAFGTGDKTFSSSDSIGYGQSKQFIFNITAPEVETVTSYTMGWQMKQNSLTFGNKITKTVTVKPDYEELTLGSYKNVYGKPNSQMYMFTVDTTGYYAIRTFYYSTDCDTMLTLYNSTMTEVASNDDTYSGNLYSRVEARLTPGTYYVELSEYSDASLYCQLSVDEYEYRTISDGQTLNLSNEYEGYYKFTVSSAGTYIIGTKYYSQSSDTFLVLYDDMYAESATRISYNDNDSTAYSRIVADLDAGTYYIRATTYDYLKEAARKKVYCKVSLSKQSSAPSSDNTADINISYPSDNSVIRLYDGSSLKISGTSSNVSSITVKANGNTISSVQRTGSRFECNYLPTESGTYTITATGSASYGGSNPSDSVTVTILVNDDGDTLDTATTIKEGTERTAAIDYVEDIDCFVFIPRKSDMYSVHTIGETDTIINVYNSKYVLSGYNDDDFTLEGSVCADVPIYLEKNNIYYFMVHAATEDGTGEYNLCVNRLVDDNTSYKIITVNNLSYGRIDYPDDEDLYMFSPDQSKTYTFTTIGNTDTMGVLYDSEGNFIEFNDDISDSNSNCQISASLEAGNQYFFAVKHNRSYMYNETYKVSVE